MTPWPTDRTAAGIEVGGDRNTTWHTGMFRFDQTAGSGCWFLAAAIKD